MWLTATDLTQSVLCVGHTGCAKMVAITETALTRLTCVGKKILY